MVKEAQELEPQSAEASPEESACNRCCSESQMGDSPDSEQRYRAFLVMVLRKAKDVCRGKGQDSTVRGGVIVQPHNMGFPVARIPQHRSSNRIFRRQAAQSSRSRRKQWHAKNLSSKGAGSLRLPIAKVASSTARQVHRMRRVCWAENQGWNVIELLSLADRLSR